jgi:2'-5' RNA ligase
MPARDAAAAFQALDGLRARHPHARWLPPEKLHLTLVFLGPTEAREVDRISAATAAVAARHPAYQVATGDGGGRVSTRRGGVCWLRLTDGGHETAQLALDLDGEIGSATYDAAHAPHPHLTLARGVDQAALEDVGTMAHTMSLEWVADRLVLFRSFTDPRGSVYEELGTWPLTGGPPTA